MNEIFSSEYCELVLEDVDTVFRRNLFFREEAEKKFGDAIDEADIRNSLARDSKRNVFLFGEGKKASFFVNDLGVDSFPYYSCAKASGGKIEMELNSDGSSTSVKLPVNEVYCKNAQDKTTNDGKNLCGYLDSVYYEGYKGECCSTYGYCC